MTACVTIHPQEALAPGRYLLDPDGRLHPERFRRFISAVAAVTVRCRVQPSVPVPKSTSKRARVTDDTGTDRFRQAMKRLDARKADRARVLTRDKPARVDGAQIAAAFARKKLAPPPPPEPPTERALTREECKFCGVPGFKGCDHFLPFGGS